jgi:amino acid adenylation domain-containing protein
MEYLLHHLLQKSASEHPDRAAVVDGTRSMTYHELSRRANQVAHLLIGAGVSRGDRVGLYLDKSLESVIAIYGILASGAAYVPLDPRAPVGRLGYIARNCGVRVLLTGKEKADSWADLLAEAPQIETLIAPNAIDRDVDGWPGVRILASEAVASQVDTAIDSRQIELDLAYILYTSGSTGSPKGVMLSHLNALTFVNWAAERFDISADDRLSNHAPLHFDLSVFDLFAAARSGAAVVLVSPATSVFPVEVARFIDEQCISVWYSVPSVLTMLTLHGNLKRGVFPKLRKVLFAGEVFPTKYLRQLMEFLPHVAFYNLYGPTETNVCTYYEVPHLDPEQTETIPIGEAISNVEVLPLMDDGARAQPGEVGELYVRGSSVMRGYWGDPARSARGLVHLPFAGEAGDLVYRTGDLVRQDEQGNYRLLGRRDSQIKSRGYRIELGEIEAALHAHPSVVECAVIPIPDDVITNRIKAYVVVHDATAQSDLVQFCAQRIPSYMIPELFEFRDSLPKTSTGKVDRRGLSVELVEAEKGEP